MDFEALLAVANNNQEKAKYEGLKKGYNTTIAPPKKLPKNNVHTQQIKQFLARKEQEEREKAVEARKKKEQLLALRAQSTKNNKKAKIMASRTKDNDFSRIKLTDEDVEANQKRERELQALALKGKLERMKARIKLVEKEKQLPHKRKRKNKISSDPDPESQVQNVPDEAPSHKSDKTHSKGQNNIRKRPPPPNSALSFHDLLKVAAERQYQPIVLPKVQVVEDRPLSKKAKLLLQEEENRARRKLAAAVANKTSLSGTNPDGRKSEPNVQNNGKLLGNHNFNRKANSSNEQNKAKSRNDLSSKTHPTVVQLRKAETPSPKHKAMPSNNSNGMDSDFQHSLANRLQLSANSQEKRNLPLANNVKKDKSNSLKKSQSSISQSAPQKGNLEIKAKSLKPSKSKTKTADPNTSIANNPSSFLTEDIMTQITNQIREKLQKELEEKFLKQSAAAKTENAVPETQKARKEPIPNRSAVNPVKKSVENAKSESAKVFKQPQGMPLKKPVPSSSVKKESLPPKKAAPTKTFHPNPYLLPPRRLLESHRPIKPVRRRVESDDDDEDDDEMNDFIDDSSSNQDDYSKYIKEIFNYDRSRYADVDEDDIEESSFAQVCQEEVRSAKIGYLEDLEEEKKEKEEMKRKMMKKKKK